MNQPVDHPDVDLAEVTADQVLEVQPRAVFVVDLTGRIIRWNTSAEQTYAWGRDDVIGRTVFEVLEPVVDEMPSEDVFAKIMEGQTFEFDVEITRGDGERIKVWMSGRPIRNTSGEVVAVASFSEDVTDRRTREQAAADLTRRLQLALDAGGLGTWRWQADSDELFADSSIAAIFGLPDGSFRGSLDRFVDLVHPDDREEVTTTIRAAVDSGSSFDVEHRVIWPDQSVHWVRSTGDVTIDEHGITGAIACAADVTDRVLLTTDREHLRAEAVDAADRERTHRERLEILTRVNDALVNANDHESVMKGVVSAVIPELADWSAIFVFPSPTATEPRIEVAHVDSGRVSRTNSLHTEFPYQPNAEHGVPAIMRTGRPEFLPDLTLEPAGGPAPTEGQRLVVEEFGLRSIIGVPIIKHGRTYGVLQIAMTAGRRRYTADDLALTEAIAVRVASKLDNIRLAEYRHEIAETLQASLLPDELPSIPGTDVSVCYNAAGEAVEVGGDFYDLFALDDNAWAITIGDVCGTGPGAAAITGLARHTVASAAWLGHGPEEVLRHLNETLLRRKADHFLTLAYGTLRVGPTGLDLDLAMGGHPLPVVVRADGTVETVGIPGTLIGVFERLRVEAVPVHLDIGDRMVFYTDGVTDVAPPYNLDTQMLMALIGRVSVEAQSADDLSQAISDALDDILPLEDRNDDIALLVLCATDPANESAS